MKERHQITPVVYLLLIKGNKILLCKRINTGFYDNFYSLPSGHVEQGESASQAIIRETKEEIDIDISKKSLALVHISHRKSIHDERVDFYFETHCNNCQPKIMEPNKCDGMDWFDIDNLPDNIIPYVKDVIALEGKGVVYSELNW